MKKQLILTSLALSAITMTSFAQIVTYSAASDLNNFVDVRNADNNAYNTGTGAGGAAGYMDISSTNTGATAAYRTIYDSAADGVDATDLYGEGTYGTAFNFGADTGNSYLGLFWAPASGTNDAVGIYLQTDWSGSSERLRAASGIGVDGNTWSNSTSLGFTSGVDATYLGDVAPTDGSVWRYMQLTSTRTGTNASDTRTLTLELFDSIDNTGSSLGSLSFTFAAGVAVGDGYIGYSKLGDTGSGIIAVDNFTPVPEPSTFALLALGFASLFTLRRLQKNS